MLILITHLLLCFLLMKCTDSDVMSSDRDAAVCVKYDIINVWLTDKRVEREKTNDCGRLDPCNRHVHCSVNMHWQKNLCADPREAVFLSRFNTWRATEHVGMGNLMNKVCSNLFLFFLSAVTFPFYCIKICPAPNPPPPPFALWMYSSVKKHIIYFLLKFSLPCPLFSASGRYRQL